MNCHRFFRVCCIRGFSLIFGASLLCTGVARGKDKPITLESLLHEMIDRDSLARWPDPAFTAREFTSYDRKSVAPDQPGWFANNDFSNFLRAEDHDGRKEYVMMDADGPGAIVCMFKATTDPTATVRVYLDGGDTPVIEENFRYFLGGAVETEQEKHFNEKRVPDLPPDQVHFLGGFGTVQPPLATVNSLGCDMYLPIPYNKHCKVTYDKPGKCYYRIECRTYPSHAPVETFSLAALQREKPLIQQVSQVLLDPRPSADQISKRLPTQSRTLAPGASMTANFNGPAVLRLLALRLSAVDLAQALRSTVLGITFDGEQTVWCPVGDFFGSGIGLHPFRDWAGSVESDGTMRSFRAMPFRDACKIELINDGGQPVDASFGEIGFGNWTWDDRSMYFHASWRQQYPIRTKARDGTMDWNYVEAVGKGICVGDSLVIHNGASSWWGEGDEKIYVDNETFPSHFGTGTEDYYGYSRGGRDSIFFQSPFGAHVQVEGDFSPGYSALTRLRSLDAIPFTRHLKFDMEIWHWQAADMAYAATTFWYALPGATCNRSPDDAEASRVILPDVRALLD